MTVKATAGKRRSTDNLSGGRGQVFQQVGGDQRHLAEFPGRQVSSAAMTMNAQASRFEGGKALAHQRRDKPRQYVPAAGGGHSGIARSVDVDSPAVGDHRGGALQRDNQRVTISGPLSPLTNGGQDGALTIGLDVRDASAAQAGEFTRMRREDSGPGWANRREKQGCSGRRRR